MKQTVTKSMFHDAFRQMDRLENFSYEGREALFDYLEDYEQSCGEEIELDVIALCCEYSEEKISDVLENYNFETLDELRENTMVIYENEDKVLYQIF